MVGYKIRKFVRVVVRCILRHKMTIPSGEVTNVWVFELSLVYTKWTKLYGFQR